MQPCSDCCHPVLPGACGMPRPERHPVTAHISTPRQLSGVLRHFHATPTQLLVSDLCMCKTTGADQGRPVVAPERQCPACKHLVSSYHLLPEDPGPCRGHAERVAALPDSLQCQSCGRLASCSTRRPLWRVPPMSSSASPRHRSTNGRRSAPHCLADQTAVVDAAASLHRQPLLARPPKELYRCAG